MILELQAASQKENKKWDKRNWHAVDLDATLAMWTGFKGSTKIGKPIPAMVERVKQWLEKGETVKIFTARVDDLLQQAGEEGHIHDQIKQDRAIREAIGLWTLDVFGQGLESTNRKDKWMVDLWDDRARQVAPNTGRLVSTVRSARRLIKASRSS